MLNVFRQQYKPALSKVCISIFWFLGMTSLSSVFFVDVCFIVVLIKIILIRSFNFCFYCQRLLTDESPRLRNALRYTIYGKSGVFDAERFIDVMQAFENFITAAKSGGGEELSGDMAELGLLQRPTENVFPVLLPNPSQQEPVRTRAALAFLLSDKGNFFREFLLDEVVLILRISLIIRL